VNDSAAPVPPDDRPAEGQLLEDVSAELRAVEAALGRLEVGSYWSCDVCGAAIEADALDSDPLTTRCADHRH
jgi:RNA polymerase-binding transcription factor DksA